MKRIRIFSNSFDITMNETLTIIGLLILNGILIKALIVRKTTPEKKESPIDRQNDKSIVGKSTFVLNTSKSIPPKTDTSGKLDIEVPLDYKTVTDLIEEQEELEKLGLPSESSSDLTFEEMMQIVNEVENEKPQHASKTGKLLYENENTDWVEQLASSSGKYQKRITDLIDLHLGKLVLPDTKTKHDDGLRGFDIGEYVR
jgi:hypothetical protein